MLLPACGAPEDGPNHQPRMVQMEGGVRVDGVDLQTPTLLVEGGVTMDGLDPQIRMEGRVRLGGLYRCKRSL